MELNIRQNIFWQWISWQFFEAPRGILRVWKNFLKFGLNYFSISFLIKTLFSPWRRYLWTHPKGFDIGKYFEALSSNLISRILGAILRVFLIIIGLSFEVFLVFLGIFLFLGWFLLPIFLIWGLWFGIKIIT